MYEKGGQTGLVTADEVKSIKFYDSLNSKDFQNRNQLFLKQKQEKIEKVKLMKLEEELSECTFQPDRRKSSQRGFNEFLKDQQSYMEQRSFRKQQIQQKLDQE